MNNKTLADLTLSIRQRADMVDSTFVGDTEIRHHINQAIAELHDLLVTLYEDYYVVKTEITLPAGNPTTLPDAFYKVLGVDFKAGGITFSVKPYMFSERNVYGNAAYASGGTRNLFYKIENDVIRFIPENSPSGTATLWYVPEPQQFGAAPLDAELNTVARQIARGYEEYIILDAAIKCLLKEESDVKILLAQRELVRKRIEDAAEDRQAGEPYRITDVTTGAFRPSYINWLM